MDTHAKEEQRKRERDEEASDSGEPNAATKIIGAAESKKRGVDVRLDALMESILASGSLQPTIM